MKADLQRDGLSARGDDDTSIMQVAFFSCIQDYQEIPEFCRDMHSPTGSCEMLSTSSTALQIMQKVIHPWFKILLFF